MTTSMIEGSRFNALQDLNIAVMASNEAGNKGKATANNSTKARNIFDIRSPISKQDGRGDPAHGPDAPSTNKEAVIKRAESSYF